MHPATELNGVVHSVILYVWAMCCCTTVYPSSVICALNLGKSVNP